MMKTKFYFGALAALALGLTGCANEDPAPDQGDNTGGERYIAVTIKTIGDTRALPGESDFEVGTDAENNITTDNIRFYFFDKDGNPFLMQQTNLNGTVSNTNMVKPQEIAKKETNGEIIKIEGILVLGKPSNAGTNYPYQGDVPDRVIAIANPKQKTFVDFSNMSITDMQRQVSVLNDLKFDTFSMSSSTYIDNAGNEICWTELQGHIMKEETEAKKNPAPIFLERLAAKVRVKGLGTYNVMKKNEDGSLSQAKFVIRNSDNPSEETTLKVNLQGWRLINVAKSTYALKNISGLAQNPPFSDWNDPTRHRCYWAVTSANENTLTDKEYTLNDETLFSLGNFDSSQPSVNIAYAYGNTRYQPDATLGASDRSVYSTAIVVRAQVTDNNGKPINIIKWGAEYFTHDYFNVVVANAWNQTTGHVRIPDESLNDANKLKSIIKLVKDPSVKNTYKVYVNPTNSGVETDYQEFTGRFTGIYWWNNGITTYRTNILHDKASNKFGVVRNHIYDYTFNNVIGLGLPGTDPENPPKMEESYLAAVVYVLNWHIVKHDNVTLQ